MKKHILANWLNSGGGAPFDESWQAVLDAAEAAMDTLPSSGNQTRGNILVSGFKTESIWDELDFAYLLYNDVAGNFYKYNLKNPSVKKLTEVVTVAKTSNKGVASNGTTGFHKTGWISGADGVKYTQDDASLILYSFGITIPNTTWDAGASPTGQISAIQTMRSSNTSRFGLNGASSTPTITLNDGMYHLARLINSEIRLAINGAEVSGSPFANASVGLQNIEDYINSTNVGDVATTFSTRPVAFYAKGSNLWTKRDKICELLTNYITGFGGLTSVDGTTGKRFNGLDSRLSVGGTKYDFYAGTIEGDIYYLEQGGSISSFTRTALKTGLGEIQSLKYNSTHDYIVTLDRDNGKVQIHVPDAGRTGSYTTYDLKTGLTGVQNLHILPDGSIIYSHQGASTGNGGVYILRLTGADKTDSADYTEYTVSQHEGAWWFELFEQGVNTYIVYSSRTASGGTNANAVPGVYLTQMGATYYDPWGAPTTLDSSSLDFLHVRVGDFLGNGNNDVIAVNETNSTVMFFNAGSAWAKTTVVQHTADRGFNLYPVGDLYGDGRDAFIHVLTNVAGGTHAWMVRYVGGAYTYIRMWATSTHPGDNEFITISQGGQTYYFFDDSETTQDGHVYFFQLSNL